MVQEIKKMLYYWIYWKVRTTSRRNEFWPIVEDSFKALGIKYSGENTENYSTTDLILLKNEVIRRHNLYAKPVTLSADVHLELHRTYGPRVSHEQLEEFKIQYNSKMEAVA